ncbi:SusC/RagA family TonB-linked outer membrane protein [Chitinophaga costaii]|nr:SusC/RagA family TonB-linked outer membrane protein [Chitinophaga costaii]
MLNSRLCGKNRRLVAVVLPQIILTIVILALSGSRAVYAQSSRITLRVKNQTVIHVLKRITTTTGITFFYNREELEKLPRVTLHVVDETADNILSLLLKDQPLHVQHIGQVMAIVTDKTSDNGAVSRQISGVVTDKNGTPLSQANIVQAGTTNGTVSDVDGRFRLSLQPIPAQALQVSYLGMQSQQLPVGTQSILHVILQPAFTAMNEVVINGYSSVRQKYSAASVTSLKVDDLDRSDQLSVDNMLQGKVPGLNINMNSTVPGAAPKIRLRGTATLMGSREPVWVIDGIIANPPVKLDPMDINSLDNVNLMSSPVIGLNPIDIERIDVLKDAAAAALYGVNGGNGVIVITTKKGNYHQGPQVSFSQMLNISARPTYRHLNRMNAAERMDLSKEAIDKGLNFSNGVLPQSFEQDYTDYSKGKITENELQQREKEYAAMNTDWFNILFNNGVSQRYNVSITGGGDKTAYYASLGYASQQGPAIFTHAQQFSGLLHITQRLAPGLQTGIKLSGTRHTGVYPYQLDPYQYAYNTARTLPYTKNGQRFYYNPSYYTPNWSLQDYEMDTAQLSQFNIVSDMENSRTRTSVNTYNVVANADYTFLKFFKVHGLYGFGSSDTRNSTYAGESTFYVANRYRLGLAPNMPYTDGAKSNIILPAGGEYQETNTGQSDYTLRHSLEYSRVLGSHFIQVMAGNELRQLKYTINKLFLMGYYPDSGKVSHPPDAAQYPLYEAFMQQYADTTVHHLIKQYRQLSWYGMLVYSYKDRYTINFNLRQDGANYFTQMNGGATQRTWSAAFKWDVLNEPRWQKLHPADMLTLRLSYGFNNGLPEIDPPRLTMSDPVAGISGEEQAVISNFANPALQWEKTYTYNAAADFSFFHNRLNGTVEAYRKKANNLLANINVAEENGVNSFLLNSASVLNHGFEFSLQYQVIQNKRWQWSVGTNFALNYTKTLKTNFAGDGIIGNQQQYLDGNIIRSGTDPNTVYAFKYTGLDKAGSPTFRGIYDRDYTVQPTVAEYYANVFVPVGRRIPAADGSFFTRLSYKRWSLSAVCLIKLGYVQRLSNLYGAAGFVPNPAENASLDVTNRWSKPGDESHTNIPALNGQLGWQIYDQLTMTLIQYYHFDPSFAQTLLQQAPLYLISTQLAEMYNNSDIRTVNASHVRLSTLSLQYTLPQAMPNRKRSFKGMSCYVQAHDIMLAANKKLHGQDPELPAGTLPRRPSMTIGTAINF